MTFISKKKRQEKKQLNQDHIRFWKEHLELNNDGYSLFQINLNRQLRNLLDTKRIEYSTEITKHIDTNENSKIVKLITITLINIPDSKFWIYHNMADFKLNKKSQIYEEWGYLKPYDLIEEYLKSTVEILEIK